jgi:hypothetical protein
MFEKKIKFTFSIFFIIIIFIITFAIINIIIIIIAIIIIINNNISIITKLRIFNLIINFTKTIRGPLQIHFGYTKRLTLGKGSCFINKAMSS